MVKHLLRLERAMPDYVQRKEWLAEHGIEVVGVESPRLTRSVNKPAAKLVDGKNGNDNPDPLHQGRASKAGGQPLKHSK